MKPPRQPRFVLLFSGHMVDRPGRNPPRFPNEKTPQAMDAIRVALDEFGANDTDVAICGGACGGDLLFAQLCLDRGIALNVYLPFQEPLFLEKSVNFAGAEWKQRFQRVKTNAKTTLFVTPENASPSGDNSYARNNENMLYNAVAFGADKIRFIALWDGKAGDGPGGTKHMIESVKQQLGQVRILDTKQIFA